MTFGNKGTGTWMNFARLSQGITYTTPIFVAPVLIAGGETTAMKIQMPGQLVIATGCLQLTIAIS